MTEWLHFDFSLSYIGEGNGNPLQYSCLENPRGGVAWWAAVCGVAHSWTWLKWLSSSSKDLLDQQNKAEVTLGLLSFKPPFSLSSLTFIKRLFSSSLLSAIRVVSSVYQRLLIFLPAILISVCALSSQAFCIIYSASKLNKQGDNIQPWCTPFPIWNHWEVALLFHVQL